MLYFCLRNNKYLYQLLENMGSYFNKVDFSLWEFLPTAFSQRSFNDFK